MLKIVSLLTDFGLDDYYVAAVKGTILRLAPETTLVDVSHTVGAGDIEGAAFLLGAAAPSFPPGSVHLAVVDPGVGSSRRILAVRSTLGMFVAPDNGLLTHILETAHEVRSVTKTSLFLEGPGQTFHGRDRFAPVAAYLARGESFEGLGPVTADPVHLVAGERPRRTAGTLRGSVIQIDRFGNVVTDLPSSWLPPEIDSCQIEALGTAQVATHYAEVPPGSWALLPGSLGTLEVSIRGENAAIKGSFHRGQPIRIDFR